MMERQQFLQLDNARQLLPRARNVLARRKRARNIAGSMLAKLERNKRQPLQKTHQLKTQVLQVVVGVEQQPNQEIDVPELREVTDIVGNTEDEEEDIRDN